MTLILLASTRTRGEAGIMVPINQMSFVLTAALAAPWFEEAWTNAKTVAVILAAGAAFQLSG